MTSFTPSELQAILSGPALEPPSGEKTNFNNPKSISVYAPVIIGLGISVTTLAIIIRIYTKHYIARMLGWEDYTAILAWAMLVGYCVPCAYCARYGGAHQWNTHLSDLFKLLYYSIIVQITYGPTIFVVRLSILLQYLRVFVPSRVRSNAMYVGVHVILWSNLLCYTIDTFFEIFLCTPRALAWNKLLTGHCFNTDAGVIATAVFNVISDLAILLLPMHSIWKLQLPRKKKVAICALFGTGFLACISSTARLGYSILLVTSKDISWNLIPVGAWSIAEISIGILCSCLPVMPKFIRTVGPKIYNTAVIGYAWVVRRMPSYDSL